ncbi:MAG: histidinol-phosphate transaminase [Gammaproteobacteria bacterium]|jgi:histidinol-phosphate aminotransferase|nr:histidinol phosphate aminotransferase [Gammaproteobacteria bacterium]MBQ08169.1 histidinol phosphate aminotransferase [Gammaproteobacteria bacterium]MDP6147149.1 histidinol-phosphate transaminase [Gammaproteobacteria bacterium]HJM08961.1 histidinol-phosphate transaminase [Gammaproteobacteria bacterium]HJN00899.1 histidinol-phosphate transaminase [Gammaproteobacteria bacterium]|tara:strand:+ start:11649 stop:12779 length:1131 start_codon:yes stop_codon:yes gene_type:complete
MILSRRQIIKNTVQLTGLGISSNIIPMPLLAQTLDYGPKEGLARLHWNENYYGPSERAIEAINTSSFKGAYYPDHLVDYLKSMIAEYNRIDTSNVAISAGSTQALTILSQVSGRKGPILSTGLTYDIHLQLAKNSGARIIKVKDNKDLSIDLESIESLTRNTISAVFIVNPNNPSGMMLDPDVLRETVKRMAQKTLVVIDEAYNEITTDPERNTMIDLVRDGHNVAISRTFSKIYGLAGQRVGYMIGQPDVVNQIKINGTGEASLSMAGVSAAIASYNDKNFINFSRSKINEAKDMVQSGLTFNGLSYLPSETNFIFVDLGQFDANDFRDEMLKQNILVRGKYGEFHNWSRVSMGNLSDVQRYIDALPMVLNNLSV